MSFKSILTAGSAVLLASLAFVGAPASARPDNDEYRAQRPNGNAGQREARVQARQERQARPQQAAPQQQQRSYQAPSVPQRSSGDWNRGDRRSSTGSERQGRDWNRRDNTSNNWGQARAAQAQAQAQVQAQAQAQAAARSQQWSGRRPGTGSTVGNWERNRTYSSPTRNQTYREGYRDGRQTDWRQDRQQTQNSYRSGYRDGVRTENWRDGDRNRYRDNNYRSWSRDWRRDNRYDWQGYRSSNRNVYRLGRYYAPYSNYRYNRVSIGFSLNSLFFGSRYWINDPWQYRLPAAYGPYRWIRYYDDALLVNTYSGEVVDVIYDFFW
jgi:hypothetical protein